MMKIVCSTTLLKDVLGSSLGVLNPLVDEIGYHLLPDVVFQSPHGEEILVELPLFLADGDPVEHVHGYFGTILDLRGWEVTVSKDFCELTKDIDRTLRVSLKSIGHTPRASVLFSIGDYMEWSQEPRLLSSPEKFSLAVYTLFGDMYPYGESSRATFEFTDSYLRNVGDAEVLKARIEEEHGSSNSLIRNSVLATIFS